MPFSDLLKSRLYWLGTPQSQPNPGVEAGERLLLSGQIDASKEYEICKKYHKEFEVEKLSIGMSRGLSLHRMNSPIFLRKMCYFNINRPKEIAGITGALLTALLSIPIIKLSRQIGWISLPIICTVGVLVYYFIRLEQYANNK